MATREWFETVGQDHLDRFTSLFERAIRLAEENGIDFRSIDVNDLFRVYRGEAIKLSDSEVIKARELYKRGTSIASLARRYGVDYATMSNIVTGKVRKDVV